MVEWLLETGEIPRQRGAWTYIEVLHDTWCRDRLRACDCRPVVRYGTRVFSYGFYERHKTKESA
jgi:hypothetical protein